MAKLCSKLVTAFLLVSMTRLHLAIAVCSPHYVGDGFCDAECNNRLHRFDDGDCCENICMSRPRLYPCGVNGYNCLLVVPTPSWFTHDTQLCYKWRPDGDSGQCGGGVPHELCAHVGQHTTFYRDDTDRRSGGCRMQWKIRYLRINYSILHC